MKRVPIGLILSIVVLGCVAAALIGSGAHRRDSKPGPSGPFGQAVLSVDDIAKRPDKYKGQVVARGVVSYVNAKERVAALISESEFAACGNACPDVVLPVRWRGELPAMTDRVLVRGEIERTAEGYLFNAANTEIVERATRKEKGPVTR